MVRSALPSRRALSFLTAKMISQMGSTIQITRPTKPIFDSKTGLMTAHNDGTTIYLGEARVYPVSGGGSSFLGSEDTIMRSATISVPEATTINVRAGDLITVVATQDDPALLNREFRITDVTLGGLMDPTRKLTADAIEPNQFWTKA